MEKLIECVPNISEGRDTEKIKRIAHVVENVDGVKLLDIDPGKATNRTVITFVGNPDKVIEAAYLLIKKAAAEIDMSKHSGEHPRMGATDVCPLVPISGISMEETTKYAHQLAERVGKELGIPVYCYENAAKDEKRRNLAYCRAGEYEGLEKKLADPKMKPDYGPDKYNDSVKKTGATAIGARDFLVAYNVNLNSTSTRRANAIAFDIREAGRYKREGNSLTGKFVLDADGNKVREPGKLKAVKGIGWYIEEYGIAQISYNLTNISITSMHIAFEETVKSAMERGLRVTGSELVGLIPLKAMLDAADYFLTKQQRSLGIPETEKIKIAVKSLGLDDLAPFNAEEKIIEYKMATNKGQKLVDLSLSGFADKTLVDTPVPGGGSVSAYVGALGVSLSGMVANLSAHKRGWDERWEEFSKWAEKALHYQEKLLHLVDEDTNAYNKILAAFRLPKTTDDEKKRRTEAIENATKYAIEIPFEVMQTAYASMEVARAMSEFGMKSSVSDGGVGALCAKTAVAGAFLNVKTNALGLKDEKYKSDIMDKATKLYAEAEQEEKEILDIVKKKMES